MVHSNADVGLILATSLQALTGACHGTSTHRRAPPVYSGCDQAHLGHTCASEQVGLTVIMQTEVIHMWQADCGCNTRAEIAIHHQLHVVFSRQ